MSKNKRMFASLFVFALLILLSGQLSFAGTETLKYGMKGEAVIKLQQNLKAVGAVAFKATGYYGKLTKSGVVKFQKKYGLKQDGIAGPQTLAQLQKVLGEKKPDTAYNASIKAASTVSRGNIERKGSIELLPWFSQVNGIFEIGDVAEVTDIATGLKFYVKRTFGHNHADVETLTAEDTYILKQIAGGSWNWTRRAIIVEVDGHRIAASMTAMPHAGRDDKPACSSVSNRSGGYGYGTNLDIVKGNGMDGHFDIHFTGSRTHGTNKVNAEHQKMIMKAYESGL